MFSLLYGLWEYVFRKEELRVLILGLDKAGKTSLLEKIKVSSKGETSYMHLACSSNCCLCWKALWAA
jgi:stage III sporulation protein SpoIIIAA